MKDLLFRDNLVEHKFARSYRNYLQYIPYIKSSINVSRLSKFRVPVIAEGNGYHKREGRIGLVTHLQFEGMNATKDKMVELLNIARFPVKVNYGEHQYYVGKAFLARIEPDTEEVKYLLVGTFNNTLTKVEDVTMWVASEVHTDKANRPAQVIINLFLADFKGDIIITPDVLKYVGDRIDIPEFSTLDEREEHINKIVDFSLKEFLSAEIII